MSGSYFQLVVYCSKLRIGVSAFLFLSIRQERNGDGTNTTFSGILETYRGVYTCLFIFLYKRAIPFPVLSNENLGRVFYS